MRKTADQVLYTPTDLCRFLESPFAAWMDRLHVERPGAVVPDVASDELALTASKGEEHERRFLARLQSERRNVVEIDRDHDPFAETLAALHAGAPVIYQAALARERFIGFADFLVRVDGASVLGDFHYEVWDTKLARKPKPHFVVQLCAYADMLEAIQGLRPREVHVVLGSGESKGFRTDDYFFFYRALRGAFLGFMERFDADAPPAPDPGGDHGRWQSQADAWLERTDHLAQIAGITSGQIRKLEAAGIRTMVGLAESQIARVPRMEVATLERLRAQARLQVASAGRDRPRYELITGETDGALGGLALLPPASPLDVYFDMEGYPLVDGGLEYLFGVSCRDDHEPAFHDWWAHDRDEERRALEGFVDWVHARWRADPSMHVYHYAPYEVTALRRLMGRHGTREDAVDELLRAEVFVDLYAVVRHGVRIGEPAYSLKNVERLYFGKRAGEVTTAGGSIVFYERWVESGEPRAWRESPILREIRDYNRADCESTLALAGWLRERQREHGIDWAGRTGARASDAEEEVARAATAEAAARQEVATRLTARADALGSAGSEDARIDRLLGQLVGFHRRESKPVWWAMFDRHAMTEPELVEDGACLGGLRRCDEPPVSLARSRGFWYRFEPDQDTKIAAGSACFFAHDLDVRASIAEMDAETGRALVKLGPRALAAVDGEPPRRLSLIPDEYVNSNVIAAALLDVAHARLDSGLLPRALEDFLRRSAPRIAGHQGGPLVAKGDDPAAAAVRLAGAMEDTCLCIQGPPGSGKTTTAAAVIVNLLARGKRVGITSNSHKAIVNLMEKCAERRGWDLPCLKVGEPDESFLGRCRGAREATAMEVPSLLGTNLLVGGTAWLMSRDDMVGQLDYLFVDEAGQVSVANLVGMSRAARNLVLLGDQMQLGQPIQGSHPGESGSSILEYLLQDQPTILAELGIFLGTTWRLHPALCRFISGAVYEDRLHPAPGTELREVRAPAGGSPRIRREAGIAFVPVQHDGNTQSSEEEADAIVAIVEELLGRELTDAPGRPIGRVTLDEILVVAPYNMQVRNLTRRLPRGARVGSVDKFQGQEAAIVILSMCASEGAGSPRGLDFLFDRNRLNVALSRARSLAIVVGCSGLANTRCSTVPHMALVNLFCRVLEEGGEAPPPR